MSEKVAKTSVKQEIVQRNIDFIYGRSDSHALHDLDKRAYVKSSLKVEEIRIDLFENNYEFLSPSYPAPVRLSDESDDLFYPSFEHALLASKLDLNDTRRNIIRETLDIREAKRLVRVQVTDEWKDKCLKIGEILIRDKFFRHKHLRTLLMKTSEYNIIYKNSIGEMFWGVVEDPTTLVNKGKNHLGKIIEKIRGEIKEGYDIDNWVSSYYNLIAPEKVRMEVRIMTDPAAGEQKKKAFEKLNQICIGKLDQNEFVLDHPRYLG